MSTVEGMEPIHFHLLAEDPHTPCREGDDCPLLVKASSVQIQKEAGSPVVSPNLRVKVVARGQVVES